MSESREAFEQTFSKFKSEFIRGLIEFGEGKRANRLVKEIDDNQLDYAHFFEAAWQAQQAKIDKLERKQTVMLNYLQETADEAWKQWKGQANMYSQGEADALYKAHDVLTSIITPVVLNNTTNVQNLN